MLEHSAARIARKYDQETDQSSSSDHLFLLQSAQIHWRLLHNFPCDKFNRPPSTFLSMIDWSWETDQFIASMTWRKWVRACLIFLRLLIRINEHWGYRVHCYGEISRWFHLPCQRFLDLKKWTLLMDFPNEEFLIVLLESLPFGSASWLPCSINSRNSPKSTRKKIESEEIQSGWDFITTNLI